MAPSRARLSPDIGLLAGVILTTLGYLLPWFRLGRREWFTSGLHLLGEGGGWAILPLVLLGVALVAALFAQSSAAAATVSLGSATAASFLVVIVVAAALVEGGVGDVVEMTVSVGLILMALGIGLTVVAGIFAIASLVADSAVERLRARHFPG
ncbi:hypothetical protein [Microbacterium invictum]|uniref:Uncharacterized protein n=1 Tax=Microbacterium invictum TaxID=515415 RepID=A0ABZ0VDB4_9MICO|nr:hypothetical protein [Microbacterium invictum]WQB71214.1 hypothetical protein T9R20_04395 [Microbacterium invictum]